MKKMRIWRFCVSGAMRNTHSLPSSAIWYNNSLHEREIINYPVPMDLWLYWSFITTPYVLYMYLYSLTCSLHWKWHSRITAPIQRWSSWLFFQCPRGKFDHQVKPDATSSWHITSICPCINYYIRRSTRPHKTYIFSINIPVNKQ